MKTSKLLASLIIGFGIIASAHSASPTLSQQETYITKNNLDRVQRGGLLEGKRAGFSPEIDRQAREFILKKFGGWNFENDGTQVFRQIDIVAPFAKVQARDPRITVGRDTPDTPAVIYRYQVSNTVSTLKQSPTKNHLGFPVAQPAPRLVSSQSFNVDVYVKNSKEISEFKWTTTKQKNYR